MIIAIFEKNGKKASNFLPKNTNNSLFLIVYLKSKPPEICPK